MRLFSTLLLLFVFILPAFSQIEDGSIVSDEDEFEPCVIHDMDTTGAAAARMKQKQVRENYAQTRGDCEFERDSMPLYIYFPFDASLLNTYTFDEFKDMVMTNIVYGIIESNQCSGVDFTNNYKVVFESISGIPEYGSIYDIMNLLSNTSGPLYYILQSKQVNDWHYLLFLTKPNIDGKGIANMATEEYPIVEIAAGVVDFQEVIIGSVTAIHEFGHLNGLDHEEGANGPISLPFSRAIKADAQGFRSPVAAGNIIAYEVRCWTGPDSYTTNKQGVPIHVYNGTANNAGTMNIGISLFRDIVDRTMVQTSGGECGNGFLDATTNNADIWSWEVLSGDVTLLSSLDQPTMEYIAYEPSSIRVIGQMTGKMYADTVTINLPGIKSEDRDTLVYLGTTLPDGQIVDNPGIYHVILPGEGTNGCDLLVNYNVDGIASVNGQHLTQVNIIPNPTTGKVTITNLDEIQEISVYSITGRSMSIQYRTSIMDLSDLPSGTYLLHVITERGIYQRMVMKH